MVGCGEEANPSGGVDMTGTAPKKDAIETAVEWSKLQYRDEVTYLPNTDKPFSGYAKDAYENEQIKYLFQFKDGKLDGLYFEWYKNGQKWMEKNYKDGLLDGPLTWWYENGQKWMEANYKDGKEDGLETHWYENGQKKCESNWKDGKVMSAVVWKPNGQKCPVTNIDKDGNGVIVWYNDDGTEERFTYKDGKFVED